MAPEDPVFRSRSNSCGGGELASSSQSTAPRCPSTETQQGLSQRLVINVPTSNAFEGLDSVLMDESDPVDQQNTVAAGRVRKVRCPPIYVYDKSVNQLNQLLSLTSIEQKDYLLRVGKGNVQIIIKTKPHFVEAVGQLRSNDVQFFTHGTSDDVPDKFVLSGLPKYDIESVKLELENNHIIPTDVKLLSVSKTEDVASYLLQFPKGATKLQELRKTKALFNVIVFWRFYSRKKLDAVQCFRCQQYGHGMRNCNLQAKCVKCGERHQTKDCHLPSKAELAPDDPTVKPLIKCANCSQNHTANFKGCPTRLHYLKKLEEKKTRPQPDRRNGPVRPMQQANKQHRHNFQPLEVVSTINSQVNSYANVVRNGTNPSTDPPIEPDLFSVEEFTLLARELYVKLASCKTRASQFSALAELVLKFVYNGQP